MLPPTVTELVQPGDDSGGGLAAVADLGEVGCGADGEDQQLTTRSGYSPPDGSARRRQDLR